MWGSLALWNQDHKWYVSVGSLIGLLATVFLCCQTAMLNKHLLWDKVINAETGWLQPVSATSSTTPPLSDPPHPPTLQPPHHRALPLYLKLTFIERCQGFLRCQWWVIIDTPQILWISSLKLKAKSFFWQALSSRFFFFFFKWNWTDLLNFCQLELFPPLLNLLKTTCSPLVFPPVTGVLFSNVGAISLCNTKQNFALKSPNTITSYFSVSSILLGLKFQMYSQLIFFFPFSLLEPLFSD